jgi:hypothetical protein
VHIVTSAVRPLRRRAVSELERLHGEFAALRLNGRMLEAFMNPPGHPDNCAFARLTHTISADLESRIEPCQFGGKPDCTQCACLATMGLEAILSYRLRVGIAVRTFDASMAIGGVRRFRPSRPRRAGEPVGTPAAPPAPVREKT